MGYFPGYYNAQLELGQEATSDAECLLADGRIEAAARLANG